MLQHYFSLSRSGLCFALLGILFTNKSTALPEEHKLNRSLAAQAASTNIQWSAYDSAGKAFCGTACRYWQRSGGKKSPPSIWTLLPSTWPNSSTTTSPSPATFSLLQLSPTNETTSNDDAIIYDTTYFQKSEVVLTSNDKAIRAAVQKSGKLSSLLAYHVRVQNQSSASRDFFVRFKAPDQKNFLQAAYEVGGPSGNQPMPVGDNEGIARSSVEVLVDGLPVWHTAKSLHLHDNVSNSNGLPLSWGEDATNDFYTVYLGRYASGGIFVLDYLMQADVDTDAPDCGQDFYSYYPITTYIRHCQVMGAGREFPTAATGGAAFEIFSTGTLPVNYFLLDSGVNLTAKLGG